MHWVVPTLIKHQKNACFTRRINMLYFFLDYKVKNTYYKFRKVKENHKETSIHKSVAFSASLRFWYNFCSQMFYFCCLILNILIILNFNSIFIVLWKCQKLTYLISHLLNIFIYLCREWECTPQCLCGKQRTAFKRHFFPSIMGAWRIKLSSLGFLNCKHLTWLPSHGPHTWYFILWFIHDTLKNNFFHSLSQ